MRMVSNIFFSIAILLTVITSACKKEAGPGGKNTINGTVLFKNGASGGNDAAKGASVYITFGTTEASSEFDQIILTDDEGKFSLGGLRKGNYFLKATYTDSHGFNYVTSGFAVTIKNKKNTVTVDMVLE